MFDENRVPVRDFWKVTEEEPEEEDAAWTILVFTREEDGHEVRWPSPIPLENLRRGSLLEQTLKCAKEWQDRTRGEVFAAFNDDPDRAAQVLTAILDPLQPDE